MSGDRRTSAIVAAVLVTEPGDEHTPSSPALNRHIQEVRGARDAGIVVAHRLLAQPSELLVRKRKVGLSHSSQVVLHAEQVLGRRRDDPRRADNSVVFKLVTVEQQTARGFGRAVADTSDSGNIDCRRVGGLVGLDYPQCLFAGVDELNRADCDALERIVADGAETCSRSRLLRERRQLAVVQGVTRREDR